MAIDVPLVPTVGTPVWLGKLAIGRLWFDEYMVFDAHPGPMAIGIDEYAKKAFVTFDAEPDRDYFVKPTPTGISAWGFVVLPPDEGARMIEGMKRVPFEP